ncbi:hypothetical protein K8Q98_02020 [Candidatus Nomurabacteria bacterium]|nr:hypothetical protein [Candidatus Nomurabacteria bacterium]
MYEYRHPPIKKSIWLLKYGGKKELANIFAEIMHGRILEELAEFNIMYNFREPLLVPIPLSKERYKERGFNQAELICKKLVEIDNNANFKLLKEVLIKPTNTLHQAKIENRAKRMKNIIGSFAIKDGGGNLELIKNRNIMLIDDVTTTGATLSEAKKVLKQAGAKKIIAFTLAH